MAKQSAVQKVAIQACFLVWPFLAFVLLCILYFAGSTKARIPETAYIKIILANATLDTAGQSICRGDAPQFYLVYLWNICEGLWLDREADGTLDTNSYPTTCCSPWKPSLKYSLGLAVSEIFPPQIKIGELEPDATAQFLYVAYTTAAVLSAVGFLGESALVVLKGRWFWLRLCYHGVVFLFLLMASTASTTVMNVMLIKLSDATASLGVGLIRGTTWLCLTWGAVVAFSILLVLLVILKVRERRLGKQAPEET